MATYPLRRRTERESSRFDFVHHLIEVCPSEFPFEWHGDCLVIRLETKQPILNFLQRGEVVRCEHLSLDNGEVDLNLIEPTGVDRAVDGHDFGIGRLKTFDRGLAAMGGAVVDDPKHTAGVAVRGLAHDLSHQTIEWGNAGSLLATPKHFGSVNVECCQIGPGAAAAVFMFKASGLARMRGQRRMLADACLDAGFLVGTDHELVGLEGLPLPVSGIEVEDAPGLGGEIRVAREYPAAMLPGRMASSLSHRHTVLSLMVATMPQRWASRTMSAVLKRESGRPRVDGSSQAMALTCTTTSGGKNRGAARSWSLFQAWQALVKEAFAPKTNDVTAHRQRGGDFVIGQTLRSQEDHSGTKDNIIWQRIFSRPTLQELPFLSGQTDDVWA